jgi:uncharacterized membrane protein HdeD (DUF308 family)
MQIAGRLVIIIVGVVALLSGFVHFGTLGYYPGVVLLTTGIFLSTRPKRKTVEEILKET